MAFVVVWEFRVRPAHVGEFVKLYGGEGEWAQLFARGEGFLGTHLMRDESSPSRFVTIDRWRDATCYEAFQWRNQKDYDALDARCAALVEREERIGTFETLGR
ncbi:MAG TPA: antibiotic biosynthesis monooxygenase family protein [Vicinamibacterales bacterium]|nr:antibiotic biosynthesis monooxygenase family protein [Vicinamibacterales bacterium]